MQPSSAPDQKVQDGLLEPGRVPPATTLLVKVVAATERVVPSCTWRAPLSAVPRPPVYELPLTTTVLLPACAPAAVAGDHATCAAAGTSRLPACRWFAGGAAEKAQAHNESASSGDTRVAREIGGGDGGRLAACDEQAAAGTRPHVLHGVARHPATRTIRSGTLF